MTRIIADPEVIDAPWITDALEGSGIAQGAKVLDVEFCGYVGTGQAGRVARLGLTWDMADRPTSLMAKVPCVDAMPRAALFGSGSYLREFVFYQQLAAAVDMRAPRCYFADYDGDGQDFILLLEDVEDAIAGDQIDGLSCDQVALAIGQAVKLHAPKWGDPAMAAIISKGQPVTSVEDTAALIQAVFDAALPDFLVRFEDRLDDDIVELLQRFSKSAGKLLLGLGTPKTLVHNDFRADNLLFRRTEGSQEVVVVDFQSMNMGFAAGDVAYLIAGSFADMAQRADLERDLFADYHAQLGAAGVSISADALWRDFRFGTMCGVLNAVTASLMAEKTERGEECLAAMAQRHGRQALDLDALELFN